MVRTRFAPSPTGYLLQGEREEAQRQKRRFPLVIDFYERVGYLPEALLNYLLLREFVESEGLYYPIPLHLQDVHSDLGISVGNLPNSETAAS